MKIKIQPGLDHITDRSDLLQDFVVFVCKDLRCMPCDIDIVDGREGSGLKTTAQYDPNNHHVMVNAKNRHFGDVLRSIAHELVHHKQNLNGELNVPVQDVGGDIEDEANARAGALLKSFAYQEGPERIYEQVDKSGSALIDFLKSTLEKFGADSLDSGDPSSGSKPADGPDATGGRFDDVKAKAKKLAQKAVSAAKTLRKLPNRKMSKSSQQNYINKGKLGLRADTWTKRLFSPAPYSGRGKKTTFLGAPSTTYRGAGTPIHSALEGFVYETGYSKKRGNFVKILHRVDKFDEKDGKHKGYNLFSSTYNFIGEPLETTRVGANIEDGGILGYANRKAVPGAEKASEREIVITFAKQGETFSTDDPKLDRTGAGFLDLLSPGPLREQSEKTLDSMKKQFINLLRYSDPLDTMRKTSGPGRRKLGKGKTRKHNGIDFAVPVGSPVYAPFSGQVVKIVDDVDRAYRPSKVKFSDVPPTKLSGNYVIIRSLVSVGDELPTISLAHLDSVSVKTGQFVKSGEEIGKSGDTGRSTGPHLHITPRKKFTKRSPIYTTVSQIRDAIDASRKQFTSALNDDDEFLKLMRSTVDSSIPRPPELQSESADTDLVKTYISELMSVYGLGRTDSTQGGVGRMFKLGVDYENASTNIPAVGQGYVDRTHSLPYEIVVTTDQEPQELFETIFNDDFETSFVSIVPDQVFYNDNGFRVHAHVATGSNKGDKRDVNLIQTQLYSAVMGLPGTPKDANIIIGVKPIPSKIKHFV